MSAYIISEKHYEKPQGNPLKTICWLETSRVKEQIWTPYSRVITKKFTIGNIRFNVL